MSTPTLTVCRGCCCGTTGRHAGADPVAALNRWRRLVGERAKVRVSDCLGPCAESDVVVVSPPTLSLHQISAPLTAPRRLRTS